MTQGGAHGLGQGRRLGVDAVELQPAGLVVASRQMQEHGFGGRCGAVLDGEAQILVVADQVAGGVGPCIEVGAPSQGLSEVLAALEKRAAAGVVSRPELSRRFAALAGPAVRAGSGGKGGWLEATRRRLSGLVSLRRTGAQAGDSVEARVARAEAGMARGDLAAALAEVAALEGGAAEVLAPWRQAAADRLAVERALATLESRLPDLLVASGSP